MKINNLYIYYTAGKKLFSGHKRRYGSRRIVAELKAKGKTIGRRCVKKQMQKLVLQAIRPRRFVPKTTHY
ncbi:IS3 family transposase [Runella slithyformis]|uniref:IS3 family transposase n=1 Tax=Runella slithyformis TaxID=106 RepID=UPI0009DB52FD